jgi:hypothetical protein
MSSLALPLQSTSCSVVTAASSCGTVRRSLLASRSTVSPCSVPRAAGSAVSLFSLRMMVSRSTHLLRVVGTSVSLLPLAFSLRSLVQRPICAKSTRDQDCDVEGWIIVIALAIDTDGALKTAGAPTYLCRKDREAIAAAIQVTQQR